MYSIELSQRAARFLDKLDANLKERIENALKKLKDNPVPSDAKFICREDDDKVFRYRIGDYRALYIIYEPKKIILVTKIDKRSKVYLR